MGPDSKVHGANMGPIWGRQDPDGPHVGYLGESYIYSRDPEALILVPACYSYGLAQGCSNYQCVNNGATAVLC